MDNKSEYKNHTNAIHEENNINTDIIHNSNIAINESKEIREVKNTKILRSELNEIGKKNQSNKEYNQSKSEIIKMIHIKNQRI